MSDLTPEQLARAEDRLRHPRPGSRIEGAREFGVDLMRLIENLRLSPTERLQQLYTAGSQLEKMRFAMRKSTRLNDQLREGNSTPG